MEMPVDVLNKRLGKIRDNGDIDFDNTMAAVDIDSELQEKFLFIPLEEIEAVEIERDGDRNSAGSGPERCDAIDGENPNWLYNHGVHALALWLHLRQQQEEEERKAKRPAPGIYQAFTEGEWFTVVVAEDQRMWVPQAGGGMMDRSAHYDDVKWKLQRIDVSTGTIAPQ